MERDLIGVLSAVVALASIAAVLATRRAAVVSCDPRRKVTTLVLTGVLLASAAAVLSDAVVRPLLAAVAGPPVRSDYLTVSEFLHRVGSVLIALALVILAGARSLRRPSLHPADAHWVVNPATVVAGCVVAAYGSPALGVREVEYRYWGGVEWYVLVLFAPPSLAFLLWRAAKPRERGIARGPRAA
jgi:hypothetical protein